VSLPYVQKALSITVVGSTSFVKIHLELSMTSTISKKYARAPQFSYFNLCQKLLVFACLLSFCVVHDSSFMVCYTCINVLLLILIRLFHIFLKHFFFHSYFSLSLNFPTIFYLSFLPFLSEGS